MAKAKVKNKKIASTVANITDRDTVESGLINEYANLNGLPRATALKMFIRRYLPTVIEKEKSILESNQIIHDVSQSNQFAGGLSS